MHVVVLHTREVSPEVVRIDLLCVLFSSQASSEAIFVSEMALKNASCLMAELSLFEVAKTIFGITAKIPAMITIVKISSIRLNAALMIKM